MKKKLLIFLPLTTLLFSCSGNNSGGYKPGREYGDEKYYALFMYNYVTGSSTAPSGNEEMVENTIYQKVEINVGELIAKPTVDPTRENYEFQGWFKEADTINEWNFETEVALGSTILFAKWGKTGGGGEEYHEPEYIPVDRIIEDKDFEITGILNKPLNANGQSVDLTAGGINRLKKYNSDVSFAINYAHKEGVTLTTATYNESTKKIHIVFSTGDPVDITVNDITATLKVSNSYYENKAVKYEANSVDVENYHIALMGSSSMENWTTSTEDMGPIVSFNHGIGGTTVDEWRDKLFERLTMPYSPKAVVYYIGVNNIINSGDTGEATAAKLVQLFDKTHEYLPDAKIFFILINKLPSYGHKQADFDVANNSALAYEAEHDYLSCIDAGAGLLKENGQPHWGYFISDGLHMSKAGYVIWGGAVKKAIMDWLG